MKYFIKNTDNNGNPLSEDQRIFFNNSKCINKQKQLILCYHGSPNKFEKFEKKKIGSTNDFGMYGPGFYFSNKRNNAINWGTTDTEKVYLYKVYLNITKPFYIVDAKSEKKFYDIFDKDIDNALRKDGIDPNKKGLNLAEINTPNYRKQKMKNFEKIKEKYDGVIVTYFQNETGPHEEQYVIFDANQVKLIDNDIPSKNKEMTESIH